MLELAVRWGDEIVKLQFEHSLLALSKWESKHQKPFLAKSGVTADEMLDYYSFMILTPGADPNLVAALTPDQMQTIQEYITDPQSASNVPELKSSGATETITNELIYYWITEMQIDWRVETWHLNRLMMLIRIKNFKSQPASKQSREDLATRWASANERQKALFNTSG